MSDYPDRNTVKSGDVMSGDAYTRAHDLSLVPPTPDYRRVGWHCVYHEQSGSTCHNPLDCDLVPKWALSVQAFRHLAAGGIIQDSESSEDAYERGYREATEASEVRDVWRSAVEAFAPERRIPGGLVGLRWVRRLFGRGQP